MNSKMTTFQFQIINDFSFYPIINTNLLIMGWIFFYTEFMLICKI